MSTALRSFRPASLAVPLAVLGGTAILATAIVWSRRSGRERAPATFARGTDLADSLDVELSEFEALLDEVEVELDALDVALSTDSLEGKSYVERTVSVPPGFFRPPYSPTND